ncbi:MAG: hypothetical protein GY811_17475 [Myxococcales bacterium]|nr:hypothetical protein [Myxococcales bacterium]
MRHHLIRLFATAIAAGICLAAVGVGALAATVRVRGGEWRMPVREDVEALVVAWESAPEPARTIYLEQGALIVKHGADNASRSMSSLIAAGPARQIPRYRASRKNWNRLVKCVQDKFAGLDVRLASAAVSSSRSRSLVQVAALRRTYRSASL